MAKSSSIGGILITVVVLGGIGYGGYYFFKSKTTKDPEYTTAKAARQQVIQSITASGSLQTLRTVDIGAQVSGLVLEVNVDFNAVVKEGDILVRIDPTTYEQKLAQAQADLRSSQASLEITKADAERSEVLFKAGAENAVNNASAKAKLIQSESTILSRQAAVKDAEINLARTIVRAPKDAIVLNRMTDPGKTVNASTNVPNLLTLVDSLDTLQIDAGVSEADIGNVSEGQPVTFNVDAYPGQSFNAVVKQVRNSAKNTNGVVTYSAIIDVDNTARRLKPGMTANVSIIIASRTANTLVLPNSTLRVRIPTELESVVKKAGATPATASATPAAAPKQLTPEEKLALEQDILSQSGMAGSGPFTPDVVEKARQLAKDKNVADTSFIDNAARGFGGQRGRGGQGQGLAQGPGGQPGGRGRGGRGGNAPNVNAGGGQNTSTLPRTVYKLGTDAAGKKFPEAVTVTLGISDGQFTEVLDSGGLIQPGDLLISYITMPGQVAQVRSGPQQAQASPFGGQQQRGGQPGGGGGRGGF